MMALTIFSWGYWGWGNATKELVRSFDLAEEMRGFKPPIFVDCRIRRQGRAKGFVGDAFRDLVGLSRYCWMDDLGNEAVARGLPGVVIRNKAAVSDLLQLVQQADEERRRILFYCACEFPSLDGELNCHRLTITELLLQQAKKVPTPVSIVEWPGGEPSQTRIGVNRTVFGPLKNGSRKGIPVGGDRLAELAALPWASIATIEQDGGSAACDLLVGPAKFATSSKANGYWYVPVIQSPKPDEQKETLQVDAARWRHSRGLESRRSV
jgi:hypothetical protein